MIAYDPYVQPSHFLTHGVQAVDYETLLREFDLVSFHVVLTKETRYMFGEEQIKLMKPHAVVINTVARQGDRREGGRTRHRGPAARHRDRRVRGGTAADGFAAAQARQPGAAFAPLRLLSPKAASCARASTGRRAPSSPRSRAASRTTSTTRTCALCGSSDLAGLYLEPYSGRRRGFGHSKGPCRLTSAGVAHSLGCALAHSIWVSAAGYTAPLVPRPCGGAAGEAPSGCAGVWSRSAGPLWPACRHRLIPLPVHLGARPGTDSAASNSAARHPWWRRCVLVVGRCAVCCGGGDTRFPPANCGRSQNKFASHMKVSSRFFNRCCPDGRI